MTYTDLLNDFLDNTGNTGQTSNTSLVNFFKRHLATRYQMAFSEITNLATQQARTASTIVNQQYYHLPMGIVDMESVTVTIGGIAYPLITVDSEIQWERINQTLVSTTALPSFIFPRRDDFGIWPTPQGVYTITFYPHIRDRSLTADDYTTGTVSVTNSSQTVTGSGTTWTNAMVGRWFIMNDNTQQGEGFWYRIGAVGSTTSLTLETSYEQTTIASGANYKIGESPELPEEIHLNLAAGVVSDYYAGPRGNIENGTWFNNVFWTGDGNNSKRDGEKFTGGILGAKQRYAGRNNGAIVWKHGIAQTWVDRQWASSIVS